MKFYNNFQVPQMMYLNYFDDVMIYVIPKAVGIWAN